MTIRDSDPRQIDTPGQIVLDQATWRPVAERHAHRVDELTAAHRDRAANGQRHPVEDFLFTYYPFRAAVLRTWHPGAQVALADADERAALRFYRYDGELVVVDVERFVADRRAHLTTVAAVLRATADRAANFGCFGLHEWAMVYRQPADAIRHQGWPLRLGAAGTDAVVQSHPIRCSHFDAFRFFTEPARPLNLLRPNKSRVDTEQPGCLHVGMDLYKWAVKLLPVVPSSLVVDCFELARDIREVDMRASPYDFQALGYQPIAVETTDGKAEYVAHQREFARRGAPLRRALLAACEHVLADDPATGSVV